VLAGSTDFGRSPAITILPPGLDEEDSVKGVETFSLQSL